MFPNPFRMVNLPVVLATTLIRKAIDAYTEASNEEMPETPYWFANCLDNLDETSFMYVQFLGLVTNSLLFCYRYYKTKRNAKKIKSTIGTSTASGRISKRRRSRLSRSLPTTLDPNEKVRKYLDTISLNRSAGHPITTSYVNMTRAEICWKRRLTLRKYDTNTYVSCCSLCRRPDEGSGERNISLLPSFDGNYRKLTRARNLLSRRLKNGETICRRCSGLPPVSKTRSGKCYS